MSSHKVGDFDFEDLQRYSTRVAAAKRGLSTSELTSRAQVVRRRWLGSSISFEDQRQELDAWLLVIDREEGWAAHSTGYGGSLRAFEEGRALMLDRRGHLQVATFTQALNEQFSGRYTGRRVTQEIKDVRPASAGDVISFDRVNTAVYRRVRSGKDEVWRQVLGTNFRTVVSKPGMNTSRALKSLLEREDYVRGIEFIF